ncbi:hypothetical protein GKZ27_05710 [Enterorhabdus mucosicola]|uniref:Uncharacterized protein n=1 Tax=Adlercreutzia mucosicola TaxID=580026 RepID=A0A6N8JM06_9ACTN|nr:hypothetical protein [Adlercreutzia mucosicola]
MASHPLSHQGHTKEENEDFR